MRPLALVPVALNVLASAAFAAPLGDDPPPREWNQPHGNAASTAFVDVAPLKTQPAERWRIKAEQLLAGPVVAQGKLYVALKEGGASLLLAIDPATGTRIAKAALDESVEPFALLAGDGLAFLFEPTAVHVYRLAGSELAAEKTVKGSFGGEPTRYGGALIAWKAKGGGLQSIELNSGKALPLLAKGIGRASGAVDDPASDKGVRGLCWFAADEKAGNLALQRSPLTSTAAPVKVAPPETLVPDVKPATLEVAQDSVLVAVRAKSGLLWFGWLGGGQGSALLKKGDPKSVSFVTPPAAANGHLYGVDSNDRLIDFNAADGSSTPMVQGEALPKGAKLGTPSIARDALYLGNWALELGSRRVLWCLDKLAVEGAAIPAGDELMVVRTKANELVGFGKTAATAPAAGPTLAKGAPAPTLEPAALPGSKPGLIRADGLFVAGKATALDGGRWHLDPDGGKGLDYDAAAVALVDTGKEVKRVGEELAIYRACWAWLAQHQVEALLSVHEKFRDAKLFEDAARLIEEARASGLPAARADELANALAGKASAKLPPTNPVRKKCVEAEAAARAQSAADIIAAAKWCAEHDAKTAASVLFGRATAASPAKPPDPLVLERWIPESFTLGGEEEEAKAQAWLTWAPALLPSGAIFPVLDESTQRRVSVTKFGHDAIVLRSRNVLLLSRELDPAVIGLCMERAEAAVRALQKLLGPSPTHLRDDVPLEIHLHKTRAQYLDDRIGGSTGPMVWSAGCYSPGDGISRFYSTHEGDQGDPLAHELHEVLAHEITHHYVDRRWIRETMRQAPSGYWMVEGFAEFVGSQAVEMGRVGEGFDDTTVSALDRAGAAARAGQLLPVQYLMELDQPRFQKELEGGQFGPVQLHHSLKEAFLDKRAVFYAEATALTFFVMNRCGEKGRSTYTGWLAQHYRGEALKEPWKELGFESISAFDKKFQAFLDEL